MKTAISVPDPTFAKVDERAKELGMSRSEFFTRAAEDYLRHLDDDDLSQRYDEALARGGMQARADADAAAAIGTASLSELTADDEW
jgi:predicted DNA-binding protein